MLSISLLRCSFCVLITFVKRDFGTDWDSLKYASIGKKIEASISLLLPFGVYVLTLCKYLPDIWSRFQNLYFQLINQLISIIINWFIISQLIYICYRLSVK